MNRSKYFGKTVGAHRQHRNRLLKRKNTFHATMRAVCRGFLDSNKNNPKWITKNMGTYMIMVE